MLDTRLSVALVIYALIWAIMLVVAIKRGKISVRYSMVWFAMALAIFVVGAFPGIIELINKMFGFAIIANLIVGFLITLLAVVTFALTCYITKQKKQINTLIQEVSILKKQVEKNDKK